VEIIDDRRGEDGWRRWVRGAQDTSTCSGPQSHRMDVITSIAVKEAARRPPMDRMGSYQYVFLLKHCQGEPRRLDARSECTADVQSDDNIVCPLCVSSSEESLVTRSSIPCRPLAQAAAPTLAETVFTSLPPSPPKTVSNARKCFGHPIQPAIPSRLPSAQYLVSEPLEATTDCTRRGIE